MWFLIYALGVGYYYGGESKHNYDLVISHKAIYYKGYTGRTIQNISGLLGIFPHMF